MAESSSLHFSTFSSFSAISRSSEISSLSSKLRFSSSFSKFTAFRSLPSRLPPFTAKPSDAGDFLGDDDSFGSYPWDPSVSGTDGAIQWVREERITLFTSEGLIQIGGSLVPRQVSSSDKKQGRSKVSQRFQRFQESDYMDPKQGLCLGALFDIAATNGLDISRRLCIFGFCRSIEMLNDVVEETVLEHGGEVVAAEKASEGGLQEKLSMTVAVPLLWGVPPASETLHLAVRSGGGIVEKVYWQWNFL